MKKPKKELLLILLVESQSATYCHGKILLVVCGSLRSLPETTPLTHVFSSRHKCTYASHNLTVILQHEGEHSLLKEDCLNLPRSAIHTFNPHMRTGVVFVAGLETVVDSKGRTNCGPMFDNRRDRGHTGSSYYSILIETLR
jgi:hypothetical protein